MEVLSQDEQQNDPANHELFLEHVPEKPNLRGDWLNYYLLLMLYTIQGFNFGLYIGISVILQNNKTVTYEDQALYSIALWPFSIKLLFAPIVDAFYIQWIGRRKCWIMSLQFLIGTILLYMAHNINDWLPESEKPNIKTIFFVVLVIIFLSSIQDIAVDGWSLTILKKRNVKYSSVCNIHGLFIGMFISCVLFTLLVSENFKNKFVRNTLGTGGLISMKSFLQFWTLLIFIITALVGMFKKEMDSRENEYEKISILQNYKILWDILKLPHIRILAIALLTSQIGFISADTMLYKLKLMDAGIPKDDIMIIQIVLYIVNICMPNFVSKYVTGPKSLTYFLKVMPTRLLFSTILAVLTFYTPSLIRKEDIVNVPMYFYFILGSILIINEMLFFFMSLAIAAFFAQISDPRFGGTYMTLLTGFNNLGNSISRTLGLKLINVLTFNKCSNDAQNSCSTPYLKNMCQKNYGSCDVYIDGYVITILIFTILGFTWYSIFKNILKHYESLNLSHWKVHK